MEQKQSWIKKILTSGGWAFLVCFVWELIEELLENLIAYMISSAIVLFATKVFATIFATQLIKTSGKRFLMPFIKKFTYKDGNDKVELLKKYWAKVMGNRVTGTMTGVGFAGIVWFQTFVPFATHCWWIALLTFVVFYNIGIFFGGETLKQIEERLKEVALNDHQRKVINKAKANLAKADKEATRTEAQKAKSDAKKVEQEKFDAEVNAMMEKIKAERETQKQTENKVN